MISFVSLGTVLYNGQHRRYFLSDFSLSFFQVNPIQTEKLYGKALEYAGLTGNETVWDLYCGIGTISLFLAQKAKFVRGVEIVPQAIDNARENAKLNGIENVEFLSEKQRKCYREEYEKNGVYADVIVVDPPRKGCDELVLQDAVAMPSINTRRQK